MGYISLTALFLLIKNHPFAQRIAKFLLVGGSGFLIEVALMEIFVDGLKFEKSPFYIATNAVMFAMNFILSDIYVFKDKRANEPVMWKRFLKFAAGKGAGLGLNILMFELVTLMGLNTFWATATGGITGMVFNFAAAYLWIYGKPQTKSPEVKNQTEPGA